MAGVQGSEEIRVRGREAQVLRYLVNHPGLHAPKEIAQRCRVARNKVKKVLRRLTAKGLLYSPKRGLYCYWPPPHEIRKIVTGLATPRCYRNVTSVGAQILRYLDENAGLHTPTQIARAQNIPYNTALVCCRRDKQAAIKGTMLAYNRARKRDKIVTGLGTQVCYRFVTKMLPNCHRSGCSNFAVLLFKLTDLHKSKKP